MYWSKIATTEKEFDAIAALNYETFVEEIPQHESNHSKRLVDKFHAENTYIVVYKDTQIVGMAAFRDKRPFSLDQKIGEVEQHLAPEHCDYLCEIRLLAMKQTHRNGRVFSKLATAIYRYYYDKGYTACVISGTVREEKLYTQMGFKQFAAAVGTEDARFLPMVLTRKESAIFRERLREQNRVFYPGPVALTQPLEQSIISHRSKSFEVQLQEMTERLCALTQAKQVVTMVGTGTLANDAMLGQLKSEHGEEDGLFLTNGEFGNRLIKQAQQWGLKFDELNFGWGQPFQMQEIEQRLQTKRYQYVVFVHSETSNSVINPLESLVKLAKQYDVKLCADCISSFGAWPFKLTELHYATAVSGKALGTVAGLAFIFCKEKPTASSAPLYMNLPYYFDKQIPFTLPHYLVHAVHQALQAYPERLDVLQKRSELVRETTLAVTAMSPMIATFQHEKMDQIVGICELNGFMLHGESAYLKDRNLAQISTIQPNFETDIKKLNQLLIHVMETL